MVVLFLVLSFSSWLAVKRRSRRGLFWVMVFSLIYFGGRFSHAVLKSAAHGDFRVQSEFGGQMTAVAPDDDLLATGEAVIGALPEQPLYARVDLVRAGNGTGFWLMEVELIEPSLCLRHDPGAAARFAAAIASG